MKPSANDAAGNARAGLALVLANVRYWTTVAPHVRQELRRWQQHADSIPDPRLRTLALTKLREEHFNAQVAATLATLAPKRHRRMVTAAIVAFQVMYDYLDALGEEPADDPHRNGDQLFRAFTDALTPGASTDNDYYRHHSHSNDGGYLAQLAVTCSQALATLPASATVAPPARETAIKCAQAQAHTHAIPLHGTGPLEAWATAQASNTSLSWWEFAAGAAASSLAIHALLAAAADLTTTDRDAADVDAAYLSICALSTLLDSLIDHDQDVRNGSHRYLDYYPDQHVAAERVAAIARHATSAVADLPHAAHHVMTVAGVAGYYLSTPGAASEHGRRVTDRTIRELQPVIAPVFAIFRLWREAKRARETLRNARARGAGAPGWLD